MTATAEDLAAVVARLAAGTGPVAVDAERASGYRYGQKAYLVQLRRAGAGTVLIDPIACPDLSGLGAALADVEAVLHAASQDLPCLAEIGYQPAEAVRHRAGRAAARLPAGGARHHARGGARLPAGEGALGRGLVGAPAARGDAQVRGARRRGADRAARRPRRAASRAGQGRVGPPGVRRHRGRSPAAAPRRPVAPHVRDSQGADQAGARGRPRAVADAGTRSPATPTSRRGGCSATRPSSTPRGPRPPSRRRPGARSLTGSAASTRGTRASTPTAGRPRCSAPASSATRSCPRSAARRRCLARRPRTAGRSATRPRRRGSRPRARRSGSLATAHRLPIENLLPPDALRRLAWEPPDPATAETITAALAAYGARPWQAELTAVPLAAAFAAAAAAPGPSVTGEAPWPGEGAGSPARDHGYGIIAPPTCCCYP